MSIAVKSVLKQLTKTLLKEAIYHAQHITLVRVAFISFHFNVDYPKDQTLKVAVEEITHTRQRRQEL